MTNPIFFPPLEAEDMTGKMFGAGDVILFSTATGLRLAKVTKFGYDWDGKRITRVSVEVARPGYKPSRYSVDYVKKRFFKLEKDA